MESFSFEHVKPVWDHIADCKVVARFADDSEEVIETLWAQKVDDGYVICSIPAFVYNLAMGDIVSTDGESYINAIIRRSGRSVFRIWSKGGWMEKLQILDRIAELGGIMEECTLGLTSVDAADVKIGWEIWEYLVQMQESGVIEQETGFWAGGDERPV